MTIKFRTPATLSTSQGPYALNLYLAKGLWSRFRGLMLAAPLNTEPAPEGLLITRCPSVHGFFMRYTIDVVYLAAGPAGEAQRPGTRYSVTCITTLKPWRVSFGKNHQGHRSAHVLELPAGSNQRFGIAPGDTLDICP